MSSLKHTHSYTRYRKKYFRCTHPECTHYIDKEFLKGKLNRCACGVEFILTSEDLKRALPKCKNCSATKEAKAYRAAKGAVGDLLDMLGVDDDPRVKARFHDEGDGNGDM